jgi:hypothetical protein
MLDALMLFLAGGFIYWAMILIVFSFAVEDKKIFWVQRILAFVFLMGSLGALYAAAL